MDNIYHQTNRLLHEITDKHLGKLDQAQSYEDFSQLEVLYNEKIEQIHNNCCELDRLLCKEQVHKRTTAKYKIDQLKYDLQHLISSYKTLQHRKYSWLREKQEREALLKQRYTVNEEQTHIYIDHELGHHSKLQEANSNIDELLGAGSSMLHSLRDQGSMLKGAQKKVLDLANTLGLSNTVLRLIERRTTQDKFVLYGGMVFVLICLYLILIYL